MNAASASPISTFFGGTQGIKKTFLMDHLLFIPFLHMMAYITEHMAWMYQSRPYLLGKERV
jgi:hypothetical protein